MTALKWDQIGKRLFETGVDHGVLYIPDSNGSYINGVAWNGLTTVTEKPSGAAPNAKYADNIKYVNLLSVEEFGADIAAHTYPDEFAQFDGLATPTPGVVVGQQTRRSFGLSYRTIIGNDIVGDDYGYKLHLVYGCQATPSQKVYNSINATPDAITFTWAISTQPVAVPGLKPSSILVIDSTKVDATVLAALETMLYGATGVDPMLPPPSTVITMFEGGVTVVTPTQPAYNSSTHTITIPNVAGVTYYIAGVAQSIGPVVITADTVVTAEPNPGNVFAAGIDNDWYYDYV